MFPPPDALEWQFTPWGPPGFYVIRTGEGEVNGTLQERYASVEGDGMIGFECTISVEDLEAITSRVEASGGRFLAAPFDIKTVGRLVQIADSEGNRLGVMKYEADYRRPDAK